MVGVGNGSSKYDEVELYTFNFNMNNTSPIRSLHSYIHTQYSIFIMQ